MGSVNIGLIAFPINFLLLLGAMLIEETKGQVLSVATHLVDSNSNRTSA